MSTDIIVIIDESGSMRSMGDEPMQALNSFISDQKKLGCVDSTVTVWKFSNKPVLSVDNNLLSEMCEFTDFEPCGMTALYDAIGMAITHKKDSKNVTCVIITDGIDNSSHDYTTSQVNKMVTDAKTTDGWDFHYLGANQDAFKNGSKIGIARCSGYTPLKNQDNGILKSMRQTSDSVLNFRYSSSSGRTENNTPPPPPPSSTNSSYDESLGIQSPSYIRPPLLSRQSSILPGNDFISSVISMLSGDSVTNGPSGFGV
jgi:hypothetical protein